MAQDKSDPTNASDSIAELGKKSPHLESDSVRYVDDDDDDDDDNR